VSLGIVRDTLDDLTAAIRTGLENDVLILSGGVSAGVLDLVPQVLKQLQVEQVFHKVRLKPGKPLWFGTRRSEDREQLVFGLPGNPVSSLVCFHLFVRPALARLAGRSEGPAPLATARLTEPFQHRGDRPTFFPGRTRRSASGREVEPLRWRGSADLRTLADADVLICLQPGEYELTAGTAIEVMEL
jgi:molybdopterin molybdotransferase